MHDVTWCNIHYASEQVDILIQIIRDGPMLTPQKYLHFAVCELP